MVDVAYGYDTQKLSFVYPKCNMVPISKTMVNINFTFLISFQLVAHNWSHIS